jgi:hypothetical protein
MGDGDGNVTRSMLDTSVTSRNVMRSDAMGDDDGFERGVRLKVLWGSAYPPGRRDRTMSRNLIAEFANLVLRCKLPRDGNEAT